MLPTIDSKKTSSYIVINSAVFTIYMLLNIKNSVEFYLDRIKLIIKEVL